MVYRACKDELRLYVPGGGSDVDTGLQGGVPLAGHTRCHKKIGRRSRVFSSYVIPVSSALSEVRT